VNLLAVELFIGFVSNRLLEASISTVGALASCVIVIYLCLRRGMLVLTVLCFVYLSISTLYCKFSGTLEAFDNASIESKMHRESRSVYLSVCLPYSTWSGTVLLFVSRLRSDMFVVVCPNLFFVSSVDGPNVIWVFDMFMSLSALVFLVFLNKPPFLPMLGTKFIV